MSKPAKVNVLQTKSCAEKKLHQKLNVSGTMSQKFSLTINSDSCEDDIQFHVFKCLCILAQNKSNADARSKSKRILFWSTIFQLSQSNSESRNSKPVNVSSWFPLHCAAFYSSISVENLEHLGRDISALDKTTNNDHAAPVTKETPLHVAISSNNPNLNIIQYFIDFFPQIVRAGTSDGKGLMTPTLDGSIPLFGICNNYNENMVQIVKLMLNAAPYSVAHQNKHDCYLLHVMILNYDPSFSPTLFQEIFHLLLEFNPDIAMMTTNYYGQTPLHMACGSIYDVVTREIKTLLDYRPLAASILNELDQTNATA
eukprot:gene7143-14541_t